MLEAKKFEIALLDIIDNTLGLEEDEIIDRNRLSAELLRGMIWKENMLYQRAKNRWIKDGDVNFRFYHCWINKRLKTNSLDGILADGRWIESALEVKSVVLNHFKNYSVRQCSRKAYLNHFLEEA